MREGSILRWEVNRRTSNILEDIEKGILQGIFEGMGNSWEPHYSNLITDPIEQFASNLSDPRFLKEWMSMTPQQQNNMMELLKQQHYARNPMANPWNWWMMMQFLNWF